MKTIIQAEEGLDVARALLSAGKYFAVSYYPQQAVGKALKSLSIYLGKDPGKTNSLIELSDMLEKEGLQVPSRKEHLMVSHRTSSSPDILTLLTEPQPDYTIKILQEIYMKGQRGDKLGKIRGKSAIESQVKMLNLAKEIAENIATECPNLQEAYIFGSGGTIYTRAI
ncbi:HEPN domain-containing protein [Sulfuracidifex tepidarius]|uniref:HEPN domain-containing protein n=1 Tax=Sulfuracidifex tepidarius TaxID=1294262 RepID=A0A510E5L3_9CREN|nr:HEPN domain-containing protein [Sulfuracidifex tepidarius]BBG27766.1 hypothetical protein IC007_2320 [Sulfuracidifex tepidarius]